MIDRQWSAKLEYLYADLRNGRVFMDRTIAGTAATESVGMHVQIVRVGLNYKFAAGPSFLPVLPPNPGPSAGPWNWSGLYAGVNFGGGAGRASQSDTLFNRGSYDVSGAIGGGTIGYNWQRDRLVLGVEGDLDYSNIKGATGGISDFTTPPCGGSGFYANCDTRLRWLGTVRGRVGYTWDRLLPYVTGGLAVGSLESSEGSPPIPLFGSGTQTRAGWTAGAGIEAKIDDRWTTKIEYLYVDLGNRQGFTERIRRLDAVGERRLPHPHRARRPELPLQLAGVVSTASRAGRLGAARHVEFGASLRARCPGVVRVPCHSRRSG